MDALQLASSPAPKKAISDVRRLVGARIKQRRQDLGMTCEDVGKLVGVSYQQIQKYENGTDRVSVDRLDELAAALQVQTVWFFTDLPAPAESSAEASIAAARAFRELPPPQRVVVLELMRGLARSQRGE